MPARVHPEAYLLRGQNAWTLPLIIAALVQSSGFNPWRSLCGHCYCGLRTTCVPRPPSCQRHSQLFPSTLLAKLCHALPCLLSGGCIRQEHATGAYLGGIRSPVLKLWCLLPSSDIARQPSGCILAQLLPCAHSTDMHPRVHWYPGWGCCVACTSKCPLAGHGNGIKYVCLVEHIVPGLSLLHKSFRTSK